MDVNAKLNQCKTFVITGSPRSGKDTFVSFVKAYYPNTTNFSSVDYIRWVSEKFFNFDVVNKNNKGRRFLSKFKHILTDYNDFPFEQCSTMIENKDSDELMFLHVRELSEIQKLTNKYPDISVIYIDNQDDKVYGNPSDDQTRDVYIIADLVINNTKGLEELNLMARRFIDIIM